MLNLFNASHASAADAVVDDHTAVFVALVLLLRLAPLLLLLLLVITMVIVVVMAIAFYYLTHWGLVMPYGDNDLGQHWFRQWLVAWRHQAITWTNVYLSSVKFCDKHLWAISIEIPHVSIDNISVKIAYRKFIENLPGVNKLSKIRNVIFVW